MPAKRPSENSSSVMTFEIKVNGAALADTIEVLAIEVTHSINRISAARLTFVEGGLGTNDAFVAIENDAFKPGNPVEILLGYQATNKKVFTGMIVQQTFQITENGAVFEVECKHEAVKMTGARKNGHFIKKKDSDIIQQLAGDAGLSVTVDATSESWDELTQYHASDWDFVMMRADVNGLVALCGLDKKLKVTKPKLGSAVLQIEYGVDMISLAIEQDARTQIPNVTAQAWSPKDLQIVESQSAAGDKLDGAKLTGSALAGVLEHQKYFLLTSANLTSSALKNWANARKTKANLAKVRGKVTFQGSELAMPGDTITLSNISKNYSGDYYVSGVRHVVADGDWTTEVIFGYSSDWYAESTPNIQTPSNSGWVPPAKGLHIGIVKKLDADPNGEHRIQIDLPLFKADAPTSVWARIGQFYATKQKGLFFMPEVGDEVVVGFLNEDPNSAVILGGLYSSKNAPPYQATAENEIKALVTKSEMKIEFNDKDKVLSILTPAGNSIVISEKDKSIVITDQNSNKVEMGSSGITCTTDKDFVVKAKGKINLEATGDIVLKATGKLNGEGMEVGMKGQTKFAAEGAQVEVKGSAMTTIKGGLVQIN